MMLSVIAFAEGAYLVIWGFAFVFVVNFPVWGVMVAMSFFRRLLNGG